MDKSNQSIYKTLETFLTNSDNLEESERTRFLNLVTDLSQGKIGDIETIEQFDEYLEDEFRLLEDAALLAEDSEQIGLLADLRNERIELQKSLLGITSGEASTPVATVSSVTPSIAPSDVLPQDVSHESLPTVVPPVAPTM